MSEDRPVVAPFITQDAFQLIIRERVREQLFRLQDPMDITSPWDHAVELGRCGEVPPIAAILSFYRDEDPEVRKEVENVIARIGLGVEYLLIKVIKQRVESLYDFWFRPEAIDKDEGSLEAYNLVDIAAEVLITRVVVPLAFKQSVDDQIKEQAVKALDSMKREFDPILRTLKGMPLQNHPSTYTENTFSRKAKEQLYPAMAELAQLMTERIEAVQAALIQETLRGWQEESEDALFEE